MQRRSLIRFSEILVALAIAGFSSASLAQDDSEESVPAADTVTTTPNPNPPSDSAGADGDGNVEVEALYDKLDQEQAKKKEKPEAMKKQEVPEATTLSELANLAPFSDVAVIQRRFLPRTGRFEFAGAIMTSLNNPFFNNLGVGLRGAYFLTEKHGLEAQYMIFSNTRRAVTNSLRDSRDVETTNLVTAKSYMGLAYKYTPIYGKITFLNRQIVPFDLYFTLGGGLTQTQKQSEPTIHFGSGQSFAITKSIALRWDVVWNFYQATVDSVTTAGATSKTNHNDLFLTIGASFFFPEATYR